MKCSKENERKLIFRNREMGTDEIDKHAAEGWILTSTHSDIYGYHYYFESQKVNDERR